MDVLVERYQRRKYVNQEDAPMLYYIRQKAGNVRVMDVDTMAAAIESKSSPVSYTHLTLPTTSRV